MEHLVVEASLLGAAVAEQKDAVLDWHQAIPCAVHQKQSAGRPVHDSAFHEAKILLGLLLQLFPILVAVFQDVSVAQDERVFVVVDVFEPLSGQEQMGSSSLPNTTYQFRVVRVCDSDGVVAASRQTPG